jgi:hypothetical protein
MLKKEGITMGKIRKLWSALVLCSLLIIGFVFVGSVQASDVILSEDFEDGVLDDRISIETTGTFNSSPRIKDTTNFGNTKAFGHGMSTCAANCFDNYVTNFKITLEDPMYISTISFKEMELFGNWGSKGKIYIDGEAISWGTYNDNEDFGREPTNDYQADTTYRTQSYSINKYATIIEIKVHDITSSSEVFIDDVVIMGGLGWSDDFESYTTGQFPSSNWTYTGNFDIIIDNSKSQQGDQSLRIHGSPGGCWEAIPIRLINMGNNDDFSIEFFIYISSDHIQGCHSWRGDVAMQTTDNWQTFQGVSIVSFLYDGSISSRIGNLGTYVTDSWHKVKMSYRRETSASVTLSYWINDIFKGTQIVTTESYEDNLLYFNFSSGDGTIWIDEITVTSASNETSPKAMPWVPLLLLDE